MTSASATLAPEIVPPAGVPAGFDLTAARAAFARIAAAAPQADRTGSFPLAAFEQLGELGALRFSIPATHGGLGADNAQTAWLLEQLGQADPAVGFLVSLHLPLAGSVVDPAGPWPAPARRAVEASLAAGFGLLNAFNVEPDLGSAVRGGLPATVARRDGNGWRLSGHKIYSSGSTGLRWILVSARLDGPQPRLGTFLVDTAAPGIRVEETWDHLGLRATASHDVHFDSTPVPEGFAIVAAAGSDAAPARPESRAVGVAPVYHGVALAARDWLATYLSERVPANLGAPLASLPRVQETVGQIEALLHTNRAVIDAHAARLDSGTLGARAVVDGGLVKHVVVENSVRAVELALSLVGNAGLRRANPLERHYRNVLCGRIHTPQADTALVNAGKAALAGAPR